MDAVLHVEGNADLLPVANRLLGIPKLRGGLGRGPVMGNQVVMRHPTTHCPDLWTPVKNFLRGGGYPAQMSKGVDDFKTRFKRACRYAALPDSPTKIAHHLEVYKQLVHSWMESGTIPRADTLFRVADKLGVDPRWLATGDGHGPGDAMQHDLATVNEFTQASKFRQQGKRKLSGR